MVASAKIATLTLPSAVEESLETELTVIELDRTQPLAGELHEEVERADAHQQNSRFNFTNEMYHELVQCAQDEKTVKVRYGKEMKK